MKKLIIAALIITGSSIETADEGPNWNYIGASYLQLNFAEQEEQCYLSKTLKAIKQEKRTNYFVKNP